VRRRIIVYGSHTSVFRLEGFPFRSPMSLKSRVIQVRRVPPGARIGYGCAYVTQKIRSNCDHLGGV